MEKVISRARELWPGEDFSADFDALAARAAADLSRGATRGRRLLRLCGQSGSGKSSQLVPMAAEYSRLAGRAPVHIAVGHFVKYFPNFTGLAEADPAGLREKTNCFALCLMMPAILRLCADGFDIILELAMLEPLFENLILDAAADYDVRVFGIVCPREVSDANIARRAAETGRMVNASSADYFWNSYAPGFGAWRKRRPAAACVLWSASEAGPVFDGPLADSIAAFAKCQTDHRPPIPLADALGAKLEHVKRLFNYEL